MINITWCGRLGTDNKIATRQKNKENIHSITTDTFLLKPDLISL
jgi:hypothetical protein